jgi:hypothetical protein
MSNAWRMGDLAGQDQYDPMTGLPIGAPTTEDPREAFATAPWARTVMAHPEAYEPQVGMFPNYTPPDETSFRQRFAGGAPTELPDIGKATIPSGPSWAGSERANRYADAAGQLAADVVLPHSTTDVGMMLVPGGLGAKAIGGAIGSLFSADPAESGVRGITHGISGITLRDTPQALSLLNRHVPTKEIVERSIQPHDLPVGSWLTPLVGDRSRSGELLTHVGEKQLRDPVSMQGGFQFLPEWAHENIAWGSDRSPTSAIANRVKGFQREAPDVFGVYTSMTPKAVDASHHMSDTLSQMLLEHKAGGISTTAAEKFDAAMRGVKPDFPGVGSEELQTYLRNQPMAFRDFFAKTMGSRSALEAGFPDVAQARIAVTHPRLLDTPIYSGGQSIARLTGDLTHGAPGVGPAPHFTYRSKLHGQYEGGFDAPIPKELLWRDFVPKVGERNPSAVGKIWLTGLKGEQFGQRVDRQWQDAVAEYLRRHRMGDLASPY